MRASRLALAAALTLAVGAAGVVVVLHRAPDASGPDSGPDSGNGPSQATSRPTPPPLDLSDLAPAPELPTAYVVLRSTAGISAAAVSARVAPLLRDAALGRTVAAEVLDVATGRLLFVHGADRAVLPASTAKLVTAVAALEVLGPTARLTTRAVANVEPVDGVLTGDLVLVGGGDPTLASAAAANRYARGARISALAAAVRRAGVHHVTGRVVVDASLFSGPTLGPGWKSSYVDEGSVAPVTALMVDGGRRRPDRSLRVSAPALTAGRMFRDALRAKGVAVAGAAVVTGRALTGARTVGRVVSPPIAVLVERMLRSSDNDIAEALGRAVARAEHEPASFFGETQALQSALAGLSLAGVADRLSDASGLSREDRLTPGGLVGVLRVAARRDSLALRPLLAGLPVAGFDGTLGDRYRRTAPGTARGTGRVRAKTGTLDNVTTLAGLVVTRDGRLLAFAFLADQLPTRSVSNAATALDRAAAALAACGCAG